MEHELFFAFFPGSLGCDVFRTLGAALRKDLDPSLRLEPYCNPFCNLSNHTPGLILALFQTLLPELVLKAKYHDQSRPNRIFVSHPKSVCFADTPNQNPNDPAVFAT